MQLCKYIFIMKYKYSKYINTRSCSMYTDELLYLQCKRERERKN